MIRSLCLCILVLLNSACSMDVSLTQDQLEESDLISLEKDTIGKFPLGGSSFQFDVVAAFSVSGSGDIAYFDVLGPGCTVRVMDSTGKEKRCFHTDQNVDDVALDSAGNVLVSSTVDFKIYKYNLSGAKVSTGQLSQVIVPRDMFIDSSDNLFVIDDNTAVIKMFDANLNFVKSIGKPRGTLGAMTFPTALAVDSNGKTYVGDNKVPAQVRIFDAAGEPESYFEPSNGAGTNFMIKGVAIDSNGIIWVADQTSNKVFRYNSAGVEQGTAITGVVAGGAAYVSVNSLRLNSSGNVMVLDRKRIDIFNPAGSFVSRIKPEGIFTVGPTSLARFNDGKFIVADNSGYLSILTSKGALINSFGGSATGGTLGYVYGLVIDKDENIFASDLLSNEIQKFNRNGQRLATFGGTGSGDGQFSGAIGMDIYDDKLYVADLNNNRIQVFDLDGNYISQFGSTGATPLTMPASVQVSNGKIYVLNSGAATDAIHVYDLTTKSLLKSFGTQGGASTDWLIGYGLYVDKDERIFVQDLMGREVVEFNSDGVIVGRFGKNISYGAITEIAPMFMCGDKFGNLYISDALNKMVFKFSSTGQHLLE